jgi:hypothetical protein
MSGPRAIHRNNGPFVEQQGVKLTGDRKPLRGGQLEIVRSEALISGDAITGLQHEPILGLATGTALIGRQFHVMD